MSTSTSKDESYAESASEQQPDLLAQFESALGDISDDEKQAYHQAKDAAPHLVEIESNRMKFITCFGSDAKAAAESFVNYWDNRQVIFGDSAFRPMKRAPDDSALDPEANAILDSGAAFALPRDSRGRSVLFFKGSGLECEASSAETYYRACFFLFQAASENLLSQSEGVVVVVTEPCPVYLYEMLCTSGVPIRIQALHVLFRINRDESSVGGETGSKSLQGIKSRVVQALNDANRGKVQFHAVVEGEGIPRELGELGVTKDMLPNGAGSSGLAQTPKRKLKSRDKSGGPNDEAPVMEAEEDSPKPVSKRRKIQESIRLEIERAMDTIDDDKTSYLDAQEKVPHLVRKESDPVVFYHFHDSNATEAAKMLVAYWTKRVNIFGPRAMNPMSQTGEGTMNRNDVVSLNSGILFNLPPDSSGNPVVFYDHSKVDDMSRDMQRETIPRIALYMLSVAAESARLHKAKGITLLLPMQNPDSFAEHDFSFVDALSVIPVRVEAVHAFTVSPNNKPTGMLTEFAKGILGEQFSGRIYAHSLFSRPEVIRALESFGMSRNNLPKSIGGQWGIERFVEWTELRTRFEWNLPPAASHKGVDKVFDFSGLKQPSKLSEEERTERSRRMNVLHSRRKREREKVEIGVLNEHVDELRVAREYLINEKNRLHGLLQAAKSQVEMIERGVMEYPSTPSQVRHPQIGAAGLNGSQAHGTPKPSVRRLVERPDAPPTIQSNSTPYPGQVLGPSTEQMQQQEEQQQQQQQHYLFPVGNPQPGSLMMFPHTHMNQGLRQPQEPHYMQVQGAQPQYAGDHSATFHYAVPTPAPVAVGSQHWQPQVLAAAPPQQQHQQPQFVVQMQPYQPVGYVVAPSVVMSNSGPPHVGGGLSDSSGRGYWVVGGGAPGDQSQLGSPPPM